MHNITILFLSLLAFSTQAAEWTLVELKELHSEERIIDLSVQGDDVAILSSIDKEVKTKSGYLPMPSYNITRISADGVAIVTPWDASKGLPSDANKSQDSASLLKIVGITKTIVVGRGQKGEPGTPGIANAFVSSEIGTEWLPLPLRGSFEEPGQNIRIGLSEPMCIDANGWIAGHCLLIHTAGSLLLPVVWIPNEKGTYLTAPLLKSKLEYAKYQNVQIRAINNGWLIGTYGPFESPKPLLFTPAGGINESNIPKFDIHELPMSSAIETTPFQIGSPIAFSPNSIVGWVSRAEQPMLGYPALWTISVTDPVFGGIETKLRTISNPGSQHAQLGAKHILNTETGVMVSNGTDMVPFKLHDMTLSSIKKQRHGVVIVVTEDKRTFVARLPTDIP